MRCEPIELRILADPLGRLLLRAHTNVADDGLGGVCRDMCFHAAVNRVISGTPDPIKPLREAPTKHTTEGEVMEQKSRPAARNARNGSHEFRGNQGERTAGIVAITSASRRMGRR